MKLMLASPGPNDLVGLLRAWRFWLLGAVVGAFIGGAIYFVAPPLYRARATVNVDFHLEQAWPQNSDREQFYYLEREVRKLEEVAMSDAVLGSVASQVTGSTVQQLRGGELTLSQPGNGGWHFYADSRDPKQAVTLASTWANAFSDQVKQQVAASSTSGLEQFITADPVQVQGLVAHRALSLSTYLLSGAMIFLALAALATLFVRAPQ